MIDDVMAALGHEYDWVGSLLEARKFLRADGHAYVLSGIEIPARRGGIARIQNVENLLDEFTAAKKKLPVIILSVCCLNRSVTG